MHNNRYIFNTSRISDMEGGTEVMNCLSHKDLRRCKKAFTLIELLVVIAIIGMLIALLLPAVQAAREAARRLQCQSNIRNVGMAVHTFHTALNGLPPGGIGCWSKVSFWVLILPYIEQNPLYQQLESKHNTNRLGMNVECVNDYRDNTPEANISNNLRAIGNRSNDDAGKVLFMQDLARISVYFCATRRAATGQLTSSERNEDNSQTCTRTRGDGDRARYAFGPPSDYAIVGGVYRPDGNGTSRPVNLYVSGTATNGPCLMNDGTLDVDISAATEYSNDTTGEQTRRNSWPGSISREFGAFRGANHTENLNLQSNYDDRARSWIPRDVIDNWIRDGGSNTIIIGEKYMLASDMYTNTHDATWFWNHNRISFGTYRIFQSPNTALGRAGVRESSNCHWTNKRFGSSHPGTTNFCFGDATVRGVSTSTPLSILIPLGHVYDGNLVSLP